MHSLNSEWFLNCALLNSPPCSNAMPMEESNAVLFLIEVKPSSCWLKHYFSVSNVTKVRMCDCDPLVLFGQLQLPLNEAELLSLSEKRQMVILKWSVLMCAPISLCLFFSPKPLSSLFFYYSSHIHYSGCSHYLLVLTSSIIVVFLSQDSDKIL